jgi:hypothetical protein
MTHTVMGMEPGVGQSDDPQARALFEEFLTTPGQGPDRPPMATG